MNSLFRGFLQSPFTMTFLPFRKIFAFGGAAIALSAAFAGQHLPAQADSGMRCDQGTLMGQFAFQSLHNNRYVRASSRRHLAADQASRPGVGKSGSFDVFRVGKKHEGYTYALRSTQNPRLWASLSPIGNGLELSPRVCTSRSRRALFMATGSREGLSLRSMKNRKWVGIGSRNKLVAKFGATNNRTHFLQVQLDGGQGLNGN